MKKQLILSLAFLASFAAQAAGYSLGVVTDTAPANNGAVWFLSSTTSTGQPSCASGAPSKYAVNGATAAGSALLSMMRYAAALGKTVKFYGTGTCTIDGAVEDLSYAVISQ